MSQLPQEASITVGGITYRLSKFSIPLYQEFHKWAVAQLPDPYQGVGELIKGQSPEIAKYIIDKAERRAIERTKPNNSEIEGIAHSFEGVKKTLTLLFRKYHPELTEDQIFNIFEQAIAEHGEDFLSQRLNVVKASSAPTL